MAHAHEKLNYVEFAAKDLAATRIFFEACFGWAFQEYGAEYLAFDNQGLEGGFYLSDLATNTNAGGALLVFYSQDLEATQTKIQKHGGAIVKPTFSFPGGSRFHFTEPSGNEFAVWSDQ